MSKPTPDRKRAASGGKRTPSPALAGEPAQHAGTADKRVSPAAMAGLVGPNFDFNDFFQIGNIPGLAVGEFFLF